MCHLVVRDVPELPREDEPLDTAPKVNDVIVMEIEVKGLTQAYQVLLEPYSIHIPGEVFIGTTIRRSFKVISYDSTSMRYFMFTQWAN